MFRMVNKKHGLCYICKVSVPPGSGMAENTGTRYRQSWRAICEKCLQPEKYIVAPCWDCQDPNGRFRSYGAATPMLCDTCDKARRARDSERTRIVTTRFSSGATIYRNAKGRCEDAPCCGCCS